MTRIIGPTGSRRRRRFLFLPILCTMALALFIARGAQAVHDDNFFELGGVQAADILGDGSASNGPDWADLFTATGTNKDTDNNGVPDFVQLYGGHAAAFIADPSSAAGASDPTTFSGFGTSNKNTDPVSTADCASRTPPLTGSGCTPWGWDAGNVPAKDDLTNVYAYEKINPANNHLILYGGIEREDPSGDSHVDLEFFQDQVGLGTKPTFAGIRTVNDIVVSMDFLKGGALGSVTIRSWNGSDYILQGVAGGEGCFSKSGGGGDDVCAFNNGASIDGGPWPNFDNHGKEIPDSTGLSKNAFTEMGVDLTALINASPCLSTFMGKTRSSGSFTSELKDFAGPHNFDVCQPSTTLSVSPAGPITIHSGGSATLTFSELNDGNETLLNPNVVGNNGCSPSGVDVTPADGKNDGDTDGDGKLDPGESWQFTCTVSNITSGTTVTAYGVGTGELSGKLITGNPSCTANSTTVCAASERKSVSIVVVNPSTELTKTASAVVTYTYAEKNDGSAPLTAVSVSDPDCGTVSAKLKADAVHNVGDANDNAKLDAGETWLFTCQKTINGPSTDTGSTSQDNTATATGTDELNSVVTACADPANPPNATTICKNESDKVNVTITNSARSGG